MNHRAAAAPHFPRPCAVCQSMPKPREAHLSYVELETSSTLVRLWLCSPSCAWEAGVHSAKLITPERRVPELLELQKLFRGNGVEVIR